MKTALYQKGVASIVFVIIFPVFMGLFVLGIEGARYLTDSARLSDVAESASLAVAAAADHSDDETRVQNYVAATVPDANVDTSGITITTQTCEEVYGTQCGVAGVYDKNGLEFNQYKVQIQSSFLSWFPGSDLIAGFDKNQSLVNTAVARKYQQDFVDIAFVTDFSGSMLDPFDNESKYTGVIQILMNIMDTMAAYNALSTDGRMNHVAVIPYSRYNRSLYTTTSDSGSSDSGNGKGNSWGHHSSIVYGLELEDYSYDGASSVADITPTTIDTISPVFSESDLSDIDLHSEFSSGVGTQYRSGTAYYSDNYASARSGTEDWNGTAFQSSTSIYIGDTWASDSDATAIMNALGASMSDEKMANYIGGCYSTNYFEDNYSYSLGSNQRRPNYYCARRGYFYNIPLTVDDDGGFSSVEESIRNFYPGGATSSSQGIIPAAQDLLNKDSDNTYNLIIVLSDGVDTDYTTSGTLLSQQYYEDGLCDQLRQEFTDKGQTLKIVVIGFDYDPTTNSGLKTCVGSDNIYQADDYTEIYQTILSLITEEIGHLYTHDYSSEASD